MINLCVNGLPAHKEELGMTKRGKVLPARRPPEENDSVLLRSAETIGRVIGTLQRELDGARGRLSGLVLDDESADRSNGSRSKAKPRKNLAAKKRKATTVVRNTSTASRTTRPTKAKRAAKAAKARRKTKRQ